MIYVTLNPKEAIPTDYTERPTVKAVVLNDRGEVFIFNSNLIGGGVDQGESDEEALRREALEEAGIEIEIHEELGEVVACRDEIKQVYRIKGFLCSSVRKIQEPVDELESPAFWEKIEDSIVRFQRDIEKLKQTGWKEFEPKVYEAKVSNREMVIVFLKEAHKRLENMQ